MTSLILDTNSILRFLLNDIPSQADKVEKLLVTAKEDKIEIFIPQIVIFEITFILEKYYHFPKPEITTNLESIINNKYFTIQDREKFILATKLFKNNSLDLVDCFLISFAYITERNLFSFDKDLNKVLGSIKEKENPQLLG